MKILLISNLYPSSTNPVYGTFVKNFKDQLENNNFNFELSVIKGQGQTRFEKIKKYFNFFKDVISNIKNDDYDMIYVHYISHSLLPLILVRKYIKKPLILNAHGSDVFSNNKFGSLIQELVIPIIKKANLIVVPSYYFKDVVSNKFQINPNKIYVSPSGGIDIELFKPLDIKKDKTFTMGYVSRIDKGKGWDLLLNSAYQLKNKGLNFKVIVVGSGAQEQDFLAQVDNLKLNKLIEYLGGKPHSELVNYFNDMDIFIFPTTRKAESLGLVGIEAMACGVPVVGSNIGGLPSYIDDGVNGKLFEAGNVEELTKCIRYFMDMKKDEFESYKLNALSTAKRYNANLVSKELAQVLLKFKGRK